MTLFGITYGPRQILYFIGDVLLALAAIYLGHALRFGFGEVRLEAILRDTTGAAYVFLSTTLLTLYVAEAYEPALDFRRPVAITRLWIATLAALFMQMALFYAFPSWWWGRGVAGLTSLSFAALVTGWRMVACWLRPRPVTRLSTLIVGAGKAGHLVAEAIRKNPEHGLIYDIVGFVDAQGTSDVGDLSPAAPVVGTSSELAEIVAERKIGMVVVATRGRMDNALTGQLLACKARGVRIEDMPTLYKRLTGKIPIFHLSETWLLFGPGFSGTRGIGAALQRLADVAVGLLGLIASAPVIALAAAAIKLESPGPAFFLQERVGLGERPFTIIKLRTMRQDAEAKSGPVWSQGSEDPRVTRVGRFLRRTRIDELPQFYNILRGDMSLVGPRPERAHFVRQLKAQIPFYGLRFAVKPGVTGWAQVKYRYGASEEDAAEKLCYDLYAVQELNPLLYLLITLKTVQTVLLKPGS